MKNRLILSFVLLLCFIEAHATHIVGGQLFFTENKGAYYNYNIGLTMYFDARNGDPGAEDDFVNIYVFRKRDNARMATVQVPKIGRKSVSYTNPLCGITSTETIMITYALDVRAESVSFDDPGGYYMVWDRCCRNGTITNIKSPGDAGSLFYLEFPPILKNNAAFHNSSPKFPDIQGDYACVNSPFFFNFGGTDADGDSLTYTLVTPRQGYSTKAQPNVQAIGSSNYPTLNWIDGITTANIIPGPKPLTVDRKTGMLSVTPGNIGLYVFSVQVDEFRNGVKIGTLTRDFQLRVVDCPKMDKPKLLFKPKGKSTFYNSNQIFTIKKDDPNCFEVMVTDPTLNDLIHVQGQAIDHSKNYFSLLPAQYRTTVVNDTMRFQICLDECFVTYDNRPIHIELIAQDESCPVPLMDTLVIYIRREGGGNNAPAVTTSLPSDYVRVAAGVPVTFTVFGKDADADSLSLSGAGQNFTLTSKSMVFKPVNGKTSVQQNFTWIPPCNAAPGDTLKVDFTAKDLRCTGNPLATSKTISFIIDESPNHPPAVSTSLNASTVGYSIGTNGGITFDVTAIDPDTNTITLSAQGRGFDLGKTGMHFASKSGVKQISSQFSWNPDCAIMNGDTDQTFTVDFITQDKTCAAARDTTSVLIKLSDFAAKTVVNFPNVITPNGDNKNDCLLFNELPTGSCNDQFKDITVFNRWGKQVYYTKNKNQSWCPDSISAGYYFYVIQYTQQSYKGGLTVLK
ncbi:gliding motility-associated C-terminal domain-containing protein [Dyadobacter sp. LHD-138]|uniref:T9SS type B sorting domain-containing protein n=1 Tax=Dyadobacter sp. LHD-138 TaxID=3071413 RepID=UPI0027E16B90|nr:gliding motility-associated C-terminal domain-containing protein [Dyadobacter sp. LHD-138]MDQ6478213.1 gliding motility-associated C-terminal domain-containing protein [Dyadobacter sp. LHD-138]